MNLSLLVVCVIAIALITWKFYRSRREGFQSAAVAAIPTTDVPPELVGNQEACQMFERMISTLDDQIKVLEAAGSNNEPAKLDLLKTSRTSLDAQYAALKCGGTR